MRAVGAAAPAGPALDEIEPAQLRAHLEFLSHDLLEGRAPSTRGGDLAAEYLAAQLALVGFEPGAADGTYFQHVAVVESVVAPSFTLRVGTGAPFKYLQDVVAFSGVQDPKVSTEGEVVFVGHGIVAPEYKWNDYEGVDIKGKIALVMVNDPPATADEPQLFAGPALTYYGRWTYKFEEAARQGAAGAILIHTDESATYPWQVVQTSWSGTQYSLPAQEGQPALQLKAWVTNAAATEIARRAGKDLDALRAAARMRGSKPVPFGIRASSTIMQTVEQKRSPNVIGVLKGADTTRALIYTAHYDHFGMRAAASRRQAWMPTASSTARSTTHPGVRGPWKSPRRSRARRRARRIPSTCCLRPRRSRGCWAPNTSPPSRCCRRRSGWPTSTSTA